MSDWGYPYKPGVPMTRRAILLNLGLGVLLFLVIAIPIVLLTD